MTIFLIVQLGKTDKVTLPTPANDLRALRRSQEANETLRLMKKARPKPISLERSPLAPSVTSRRINRQRMARKKVI